MPIKEEEEEGIIWSVDSRHSSCKGCLESIVMMNVVYTVQ
jgi:hypothetical protein